jgi:hypothetical protein
MTPHVVGFQLLLLQRKKGLLANTTSNERRKTDFFAEKLCTVYSVQSTVKHAQHGFCDGEKLTPRQIDFVSISFFLILF